MNTTRGAEISSIRKEFLKDEENHDLQPILKETAMMRGREMTNPTERKETFSLFVCQWRLGASLPLESTQGSFVFNLVGFTSCSRHWPATSTSS